MNKIDAYEIDDQFDPLEDMGVDDVDDEEAGPDQEYLPQIPDAELTRMPEAIPLTTEERIDNMIAGMPGQKQRILYAIELFTEPKMLDDASIELDEAFPAQVSVYTSPQIIKLLEKAGALESDAEENKGEHNTDTSMCAEGDYLVVVKAKPVHYTATEDGLAAIKRYYGDDRANTVLTESNGRYMPLYQKILEMTSVEDGCQTPVIDAAIDQDPLCAEPRRFATYFVDRLEEIGAIAWEGAWVATENGKKLLSSELFTRLERS